MSKVLGPRWAVVAAGAAMLLVLAAACSVEKIEVPGETIVTGRPRTLIISQRVQSLGTGG